MLHTYEPQACVIDLWSRPSKWYSALYQVQGPQNALHYIQSITHLHTDGVKLQFNHSCSGSPNSLCRILLKRFDTVNANSLWQEKQSSFFYILHFHYFLNNSSYCYTCTSDRFPKCQRYFLIPRLFNQSLELLRKPIGLF